MSGVASQSGLFLAFLAASVLLALTPGPDMALILSRTLAGGRRHGFAALAGAMAGLVAHTFAAALGLSAVLAASSSAYSAVRYVGAAYLLVLAWGALRHGAALKLDAAAGGAAAGRPLRSFLAGLGVNMTNPKIVLFFVTFLPQFVAPGDPDAIRRFFELGASFLVVAAAINAIIIVVASQTLAAVRARPGALRAFDYGFAALMGVFAARLVWAQR